MSTSNLLFDRKGILSEGGIVFIVLKNKVLKHDLNDR